MHPLRTSVAIVLITLTASAPSYAQTPRTTPSDSRRFHELVQTLEPAAFVSVRLTNGKRLTGTVLGVSEDSFTLQRHARIPEPTRDIRFDDVVSLERARPGMNSGAKVLAGVGASVGAFLLVMIVAVVAIGD